MGVEARLSDASLLALVAEGDSEALLSLYDRYSLPLHSLALAICGQPGRAEEAVSKSFASLAAEASSLLASRFDPLLHLLVTLRRELGSRACRPVSFVLEAPPSGAPAKAAEVRLALGRLGSEERWTLAGCFLGGRTVRELAAVKGRSPEEVLGALGSALEKVGQLTFASGQDGHPGRGRAGAAFVLGGLEPEEEEDFLAHLKGCRECEEAVGEWARAAASLCWALPLVPAPARVREELARGGGEGLQSLGLPGRHPRPRWVSRLALALGCLALLLLVLKLAARVSSLPTDGATLAGTLSQATQICSFSPEEKGWMKGALFLGATRSAVSICGLEEPGPGEAYFIRVIRGSELVSVSEPLELTQGCALALLGQGIGADMEVLVVRGTQGSPGRVVARASCSQKK